MKGDQPGLHDTLVALCAEREPFDRLEPVDRGRHGRQEHRRAEVFEVEGRLDRGWRPWVACAARVTRLTWRKDTRTGLWARGEEIALYAHGGAIELPLGPDGRQLEGSLDAQTTFRN